MNDKELLAYLERRANHYQGTASDILSITPTSLDSPEEIHHFWADKHLSHIQSQHNHPDLSHDWNNIMPEDPSANLTRGSSDMTHLERISAQVDNHVDAAIIDISPGFGA